MNSPSKGDFWLGLLSIMAGVLLIFIWIPADVESGLVSMVRRQLVIGDALGPTAAGCVILIGGLLILWHADPKAKTLNRRNFLWLGVLSVVLLLSLLLMRYAGPALAALLTDTPYRALRSTPPWSYLGHVLGGTVLISGLAGVVTRNVSPAIVVAAFITTLAIAGFYDLPFDDLLLPPNGDV